MDVQPLLQEAMRVMEVGCNALAVDRKLLLNDALGNGGSLELRVAVRDGEPRITLVVRNLDDETHELGRLLFDAH